MGVCCFSEPPFEIMIFNIIQSFLLFDNQLELTAEVRCRKTTAVKQIGGLQKFICEKTAGTIKMRKQLSFTENVEG